MFHFVLFDMIGTTIADTYQGGSLILDSFSKAFRQNGIEVDKADLNRQRGKTKRLAIAQILKQQENHDDLTERIYQDFMNELIQNLDSFTEMPGASLVFDELNSNGVNIGIGSGLPLSFINQLIDHLNWNRADFDYINSSDELGESRPNPIMILDAMQQLNLNDKSKMLKVGDTVSDVMEGKNAHVKTALVLSGSHTTSDLGKVQPDFVLQSIVDIPAILNS